MKIAFSTLGCWEWDINMIVMKAKEYGYDGVDFRGYLGNKNIYECIEFREKIDITLQIFKSANIEIPCLSSSVHLCTDSDGGIQEFTAYANLCQKLGTKYIRVFGGAPRGIDRKEIINLIVERLNNISKIAEDYNLVALLETHDAWISSVCVACVMENVNSEHIGVLWDIHHPYRLANEPVEETWERLKQWIKYTHWKDSFLTKEESCGYKLCLPGRGDIPLRKIYKQLKKDNYKGYLTLEWERPWRKYLEPPDIAFSEFVKLIRNFELDQN